MGALDDLIAARPKAVVLDDAWHERIAEARAVGITWVAIASAIAQDTDTSPMGDSTLRDRHSRWLRTRG